MEPLWLFTKHRWPTFWAAIWLVGKKNDVFIDVGCELGINTSVQKFWPTLFSFSRLDVEVTTSTNRPNNNQRHEDCDVRATCSSSPRHPGLRLHWQATLASLPSSCWLTNQHVLMEERSNLQYLRGPKAGRKSLHPILASGLASLYLPRSRRLPTSLLYDRLPRNRRLPTSLLYARLHHHQLWQSSHRQYQRSPTSVQRPRDLHRQCLRQRNYHAKNLLHHSPNRPGQSHLQTSPYADSTNHHYLSTT